MDQESWNKTNISGKNSSFYMVLPGREMNKTGY